MKLPAIDTVRIIRYWRKMGDRPKAFYYVIGIEGKAPVKVFQRLSYPVVVSLMERGIRVIVETVRSRHLREAN